MFINHKLNQAGDSIIEVLIAIAIISLVLTSAFVLTNQSSQATQTTQEQTQAQQLVQGQIEFLRTSGTIDPAKTCFDSSGNAITGAACTVTPSGAGTAAYTLSISATDTTCQDSYTIRANWDTLGGTNANVTMCYRPS